MPLHSSVIFKLAEDGVKDSVIHVIDEDDEQNGPQDRALGDTTDDTSEEGFVTIYVHPEEAAHEVVLWEPLHGNSKRGAPEMNYVKLLRKDTGLEEAAEIKTAMMDREGWRDRARRTSGPPTG